MDVSRGSRSPNCKNLYMFHVKQLRKYLPVRRRIYLPICTIKMEISDGFTPLIRDAWPNVFGRNLVNFSLASIDKEWREW